MKFLAAAIQMLASDDKEANLRAAEAGVREATARGARVIALPEVFSWRGDKAGEKKNAEPLSGRTADLMARLARELGIYLLAGSFLEDIPEVQKCYNTSLFFGPQGNLLARYRKIHLFDVAIERGVST
jgi:predicted amidohydrolase